MIGIEKGQTIYFLGIGGIAMAQTALLLQEMGYEVRGSDVSLYPPTDRLLQEGGIAIEEGYDPAHLFPHPDLVVIGNAVSRGNPEVEAVLDDGIPYLSLPELVQEVLLRERQSMVVAGTHGKTTTASLLAWLLFKGGLDPSLLIGGIPLNFGQGFRFGKGDWVVLEGDEYDSAFFDKRPKFLHYLPQVVILNDIEYDHADIYQDLEEVKLSFRRLLDLIPRKGIAIACIDDEAVREVISRAPCRVDTFGAEGRWSPKGVRVTPKGTSFCLYRGEEDLGEFEIPLWGEHNLRNAMGAVVAACLLGLSLPDIRQGLRTFQGVRRRMEVVGEARGITVIDDFAHHPTAVRATLRAVRSRFSNGRLWAIFEPRTQTMRRGFLHRELALALGEADRVVIGSVPSPPAQGSRLDPQRLVQDIKGAQGTAAIYLEDPEEITAHCVAGVAPGDVIVVMSSGYFAGLPGRISNALNPREGLHSLRP
ncbi:MAG: UDP-N-acetylmuramate:L-alanyl-gamma-D-glutamyl-meso-diaminopimelate ligase [Deltaproteobacteria bacterium]|nr:UDP-N-acetylmuramate:L-alanyl-gamma-D-glutamyl-meso-diaminopimelate ligase [Deltaproteobacteria bacterium]